MLIVTPPRGKRKCTYEELGANYLVGTISIVRLARRQERMSRKVTLDSFNQPRDRFSEALARETQPPRGVKGRHATGSGCFFRVEQLVFCMTSPLNARGRPKKSEN